MDYKNFSLRIKLNISEDCNDIIVIAILNSNKVIASWLDMSMKQYKLLIKENFNGCVKDYAYNAAWGWIRFKNKEDAKKAFEWIESRMVMKTLLDN